MFQVGSGTSANDKINIAIGAVDASTLNVDGTKVNVATGDYYAGLQTATFFPEVDLVFEVTGPEHYHVPLLLSPFAYSTYRGS